MEGLISFLKLNNPFNLLLKAIWEGQHETVQNLLKEGACVDDGLSSVSPLHVAVYKGFDQIVEALLDLGANVDYKCTYCGLQDTALHFAVQKGYRSIVELLLNHDANVNLKNKFGKTPMCIAAMNEYYDIVEQLLLKGASPNFMCIGKSTLLHHLVEKEHEGPVKLVLRHGAEADIRDGNGQTPLHLAVMSRHAGMVEELLRHGANANARCKPKFTSYLHHTPLSMAAKLGDELVFQILLDHGANAHTRCQLESKKGVTILHYVAQLGCNGMANLLINYGADVNARDGNGKTPLFYALKYGQPETYQLLQNRGAIISNPTGLLFHAAVCGRVEIVKDLLKRKANINSRDKHERTMLHRSIRNGKSELSLFLLRQGILYDHKDRDCLTPLHEAASKGMEEVVERLVGAGSCVNSVDRFGNVPLNFAIKPGNEATIRILLENGTDVGLPNAFGKTPLYFAIEIRSLAIMGAILDHGANINDVCYYAGFEGNFTPLHLCVIKKMNEAVELLLVRGAQVNCGNEDRQTILCAAVERGIPDIVEILLKFGADVNEKGPLSDSRLLPYRGDQERIMAVIVKRTTPVKNKEHMYGNTPLHIAAMRGNLVISEVLLKHRADVNTKNSFGQTPLHFAAEKGNSSIVSTLLKHGAVVDSKNNAGKTALYLAAKDGSLYTVKDLLSYGADINAKDGCGRTALYIACEKKHEEIVTHFLDYGPDIIVTDLNKNTIYNFLLEGNAEYKVNVLLYLMRHVIKLKAAQLHVSIENLEAIQSSTCMQKFYDECEKEIGWMVCENISGNVSLYEILSKPFDRVVAYMRNLNVCQVLEAFDFKGKYPIYGSTLDCRYRRAIEKKCLIESATNSLNFIVGFHLPSVIVHQVFSYVGVNDLVHLSSASDISLKLPWEKHLLRGKNDLNLRRSPFSP